MDIITYEYMKGTVQIGRCRDIVREVQIEMVWACNVQRRDAGYAGRRMLRMEPPNRRRERPKIEFMDVGEGGLASDWCHRISCKSQV